MRGSRLRVTLATVCLLVARAAAVGRAYAFNLAGSGLGCLIVFPAVDQLGAESTLVLVAAMALASAGILGPAKRASFRAAFAGVAALLVAAQIWGATLFTFLPERQDQLGVVLGIVERLRARNPNASFAAVPLYSRWDRTGRIDVHRLQTPNWKQMGYLQKPMDALLWTQDGSAGSILLGVRDDPESYSEFFDRTVYGSGYALGDRREVLIIGLGGGPDLQTALYHDAERVVGVEINATGIEIIRNHFRDYLGDPAGRSEVTLHRMDGRAFVRGSRDSYDLIQMSGVDTKSMLAAGSLSVTENYH